MCERCEAVRQKIESAADPTKMAVQLTLGTLIQKTGDHWQVVNQDGVWFVLVNGDAIPIPFLNPMAVLLFLSGLSYGADLDGDQPLAPTIFMILGEKVTMDPTARRPFGH